MKLGSMWAQFGIWKKNWAQFGIWKKNWAQCGLVEEKLGSMWAQAGLKLGSKRAQVGTGVVVRRLNKHLCFFCSSLFN